MTVGWAVVGCGWAAGEMCTAVGETDGARIVAVYDRDDARADAFSTTYGAARASSFESLLGIAGIDVVYVALPHVLLQPTAAQAIAAGKHVLVEKPMALDVGGVRSLGQAASEHGVVAAPVFELRGRPVVEAARALVRDGAIGDVRAVRVSTVIDKPQAYWEGAPWRARRADAGGGVVLMNAIHQLDVVRYLTGLELTSVVADIATLHASVEVEDTAAAVFRLSNGGLLSLTAAAHSHGAEDEERIEIDGSVGRIDLANTGETLRVHTNGVWSERICAGPDAYATYVGRFLGAVTGTGAAPATTTDAAAALGAVLGVYRSAAEGRRVDVER